ARQIPPVQRRAALALLSVAATGSRPEARGPASLPPGNADAGRRAGSVAAPRGAAAGDLALLGRAFTGEADLRQSCGDAGGVEAARSGSAQQHGRARPRGADSAAF